MLNTIVYTVILSLFLVLCLYGIRIRQPNKDIPFLLNRRTTDVLRGYAIMSIMLHHMVLRMSSASILIPFRLVGYLGVSIFFFLSGYGLYHAYEKKKDIYVKGFMLKRIESVYVPAVIAQLFFMLAMMIVFHQQYKPLAFLRGLLGLYPVDSSQWYVLAALYHYFVFWLSIRFLKAWKHRTIFLFAAAVVYFVFCVLMGFSKNWYDTAFCFSLGVTFAAYGKRAFAWIQRVKITLPVLLAVLGLSVYFSYGKEDAAAIAFRCVSSITFVLLVIALLCIVDVEGCKLSAYIGTISLECYLMHGKAIRLCEKALGDIAGLETLAYLLLTAVLVFGFSFLMKHYRAFLKHEPKMKK